MEELKAIIDRTASIFIDSLDGKEEIIPVLYQKIALRREKLSSVTLEGIESVTEDVDELPLEALQDLIDKLILFSVSIIADNEHDKLEWFWKSILKLSWSSWRKIASLQNYDWKKENIHSDALIDCFHSMILLQFLIYLFKCGFALLHRKKSISATFRDPKLLGEMLAFYFLFRSFFEDFSIEEWHILHQISIHEHNNLIRSNLYGEQLANLKPSATNPEEFPTFFHFRSITSEGFTKSQFSGHHHYTTLLFLEKSFLSNSQSSLIEPIIKDDLPQIFNGWQDHLLAVGNNHPDLLSSLLQDIFTYSHIELAKCWNTLPNHFECDQLFSKAYLLSFRLISDSSLTRLNPLHRSRLEIQSSGMVGMIAIIMRLLDRYDSHSYLLATHFLSQACQYITASQLLPLLEWIIEKVSVMFNLIDDPFIKFYLSRVFQSMVMISNDSNLLLHHAYQYLDSTIKAICKEYDAQKVWFSLLSLQFCFIFYRPVMIHCYLTKLRIVTSHCLHLWHLPLQKLALLQLEYLLQHFSTEMTSFIALLLGDLFRNYLFYMKKVTPDISMASPEEVAIYLDRLLSVKERIATQYPKRFHRWCDQFQDLHSSASTLPPGNVNVIDKLLVDDSPITSVVELRKLYSSFNSLVE